MTHFLSRTALILLSTTALAACSTYVPFEDQSGGPARPSYPTTLPPQGAPPSGAPPTATTPVPEGTPLPQVRPAPPIVESQPLPPAPSAPIAPPPPPPPRMETVTRTTVTGPVVDVAGPAQDYTVVRGDNLDAIARKLGVSREQLAQDNNLHSPYGLMPGRVLKGPASTAKAYVVGHGDTLSGISRRFGVSVADITQLNSLEPQSTLSLGQQVLLPQGFQDRGPVTTTMQVEAGTRPSEPAYVPPPAPTMETVSKKTVTGRVVDATGPRREYTVKQGDNLGQVARKLDTSIEDLAKDNKLKSPYPLHLGQVLKGPASEGKAYVVGSGDTLAQIAKRFGVTVGALADANDISTKASLAPGRKLLLPDGFRDKGPIVTKTQVEVAGSRAPAYEPPAPTPAPTRSGRPSRSTPPPPQEEPEEAAPERTTTTETRSSVTGRVVDVTTGGERYTVKKHDNLDSIARKLDTDRETLAKENKLKAPYALKPGQSLRGPAGKAKAYVAGEGDTLAQIAKRFGVSVNSLAQANDMRTRDRVKAGRKLTLPDGYKDKGPIREKVTVTTPTAPPPSHTYPPVGSTPAVTPPPSTSTYNRPAPSYTPPATTTQPSRPAYVPPASSSGAIIPNSGPLSDAQISALGRGRLIWPLKGDVISDFGPKGTGQRNDGLNIRAVAGESVRAAAAGDVVYAGDQVPGFGNLVLIKHADGWVTAYGHLGRVDVKMQQKITQGQQIGQAGSSGGVSEPQLHFEVRYAPSAADRARPIDPRLVLPK
jgi:murein DD-endopeptidase MepM/ murein hydrolase activator NlpD